MANEAGGRETAAARSTRGAPKPTQIPSGSATALEVQKVRYSPSGRAIVLERLKFSRDQLDAARDAARKLALAGDRDPTMQAARVVDAVKGREVVSYSVPARS